MQGHFSPVHDKGPVRTFLFASIKKGTPTSPAQHARTGTGIHQRPAHYPSKDERGPDKAPPPPSLRVQLVNVSPAVARGTFSTRAASTNDQVFRRRESCTQLIWILGMNSARGQTAVVAVEAGVAVIVVGIGEVRARARVRV